MALGNSLGMIDFGCPTFIHFVEIFLDSLEDEQTVAMSTVTAGGGGWGELGKLTQDIAYNSPSFLLATRLQE